MSWLDFWNTDTPIYVNERHKTVHYRAVADDILGLFGDRPPTVIDFGCGEALSADRVADRSKRLYLCDGAERVRAGLMARYANNDRISVVAPEALEDAVPAGTADLIVLNSVVQYMTRDEFARLLSSFETMLAPEGRLVVADVLPPEQSAVQDALALLRLGLRNGFLLSALVGLGRAAVSPYVVHRAKLGLTRYRQDDLLRILQDAGLRAKRRYPNMGHNQQRMMFEARRPEHHP